MPASIAFEYGVTNAMKVKVTVLMTTWSDSPDAAASWYASLVHAGYRAPSFQFGNEIDSCTTGDPAPRPDGEGGLLIAMTAQNNVGGGDFNMRVRFLCRRTVQTGARAGIGGMTGLLPGESTPIDPAHGAERALNVYLPRNLERLIVDRGIYRQPATGGPWVRLPDNEVQFAPLHVDELDPNYAWLTARTTNNTGVPVHVVYRIFLKF